MNTARENQQTTSETGTKTLKKNRKKKLKENNSNKKDTFKKKEKTLARFDDRVLSFSAVYHFKRWSSFFSRVNVFFIFLNCFFIFFPVSLPCVWSIVKGILLNHHSSFSFSSVFSLFFFKFFFLAQLLLQSDVTFGCV